MTTEWSLLEANLRGCLARAKIFAPHNIEEIVRRIQQGFSAVDDLRCFGAIEAGRPLTPEAKKRLGLNARAKFTEEFIALVDVAKTDGTSPLVCYRNAYREAIAQTRRSIDVEKMRQLGVKFVELIDPYQGMGGCGAKKKKYYSIDDLPSLPLPGCEQEYCKCCYAPKI
jgi:hypothetical protein